MISLKDIEDSTPAFLAYMEEVDRRLRDAGVPIPGRPIVAFRELAKDGIKILMAAPIPTPHADRIHAWFERRYGDRLKIDFSIGKAVILIRGDPYVVKLPLIYGKWDGIIDVTKVFDGMTKELFADLPNPARTDMVNSFKWMMDRFSVMQSLPVDVLSNLNTTVTQIMAQVPHYGEAKWAALQFAEKSLKEFIKAKGGEPRRTHDLTALLRNAELLGLQSGFWPIISMIQCPASVRYDGGVSLQDAVLAHHASIDLCAHIAQELSRSAQNKISQNDVDNLVISFSFGLNQADNGGLLFKFVLASGNEVRLHFFAPTCIQLVKAIRSSMAKGYHKDERSQFVNGRDSRNMPPRHPVRAFLSNMPPLSSKEFDMEMGLVSGYAAEDHGNAVTFEFRLHEAEPRVLIMSSAVLHYFVDYLEAGIKTGQENGLFR